MKPTPSVFKRRNIDFLSPLCLAEGNVQLLQQPSSRIGRCPPPSPVFTGREDILEQMKSYFSQSTPLKRHVFVLCGLGGSGKTQLALKFVNLNINLYVEHTVVLIISNSNSSVVSGMYSVSTGPLVRRSQLGSPL